MGKDEIKEILCQQIRILAEKSKECPALPTGFYPALVDYSNTICNLVNSYISLLRSE